MSADRIPSGTRDVLPDEMRELRAMTERMRDVFAHAGYGEVSTPALEYEQTFSRAGLPQVGPGYRVFDGQGEVLVLRSDMTVPMARVVATRYARAQPPLRFCYVAPAWRPVRAERGHSREFQQIGIELIGVPGPEGTAETLRVLCDTLDAAGLRDYRIGLGDASLFRSLFAAVGIGGPELARVLGVLSRGDFVGLQRELSELTIGAPESERLLAIARLRGGPEILESSDGALHAATAPLRELHGRLPDTVARRMIYDLGLMRSVGYYTGAVFQVFDPAIGLPLGNGGRYDDLLGQFGRALPAVGFAINLDRLHIALTGEERGRR